MRDAPDPRRLSLPERDTPAHSGLIFAGGRATRLGGTNKALLEVGDHTIVRRILDVLGPLVAECVVITNDDSLGGLDRVRLIYDSRAHAGVLSALATGLEAAQGELCLAVACDMPFISGALFGYMLDLQQRTGAEVVIPRAAGFLEPMHALYKRAPVLNAIRAALDRGEQRMISYFPSVNVYELGEVEWRPIDPAGRAFFNVNTPADLEAARQLAAQS